MSADAYDALETRDPAEREAAQFAQLRALLERLGWAEAPEVRDRAALAALPLLRKADIRARQRAMPPLGGLSPLVRPAKLFQSPGPIYEPEAPGPDPWRMARALWAAGFREGDLVHNSFSYHLTPAGSMMEGAALALGCSVVPAGIGATDLQLQAIADLRPTAYAGTPSFLRILLEKGAQGLTKALVSGEAFPPALREWCAARGVQGYQAYATADCGLIAYETPARAGLVVDEGVLVELVQPGSGHPVAAGEVGEVVVTRLDAGYPLIRYATGDLSAELPERSPCGRTNRRLKGWLGRADQSAKVRGLFVHESQVQQLRTRFPSVAGWRWVIAGELANDRFVVQVLAAEDPGLAAQVQDAVRDLTKLRCEVAFVTALPTDGRVIEDRRAL